MYGLWSRGLGVGDQGCVGVAVRGFTLEKILSRKIPLKALQTYSFWAGNPWSSLKSLLFTLSLSFTSKLYRIRWGSGGRQLIPDVDSSSLLFNPGVSRRTFTVFIRIETNKNSILFKMLIDLPCSACVPHAIFEGTHKYFALFAFANRRLMFLQ